MTSAQTRAIREQQEHIGALVAKNTQLHDLILAVLAANDGLVRIPEGVVMTARRQSIVQDTIDGCLVLMTEERARRATTSLTGRVRRILVGG